MPEKRYYKIKIYDADRLFDFSAEPCSEPIAETYVCLNGVERSMVRMQREARSQFLSAYSKSYPVGSGKDVVLYKERIDEDAYYAALDEAIINGTQMEALRVFKVGLFTLVGKKGADENEAGVALTFDSNNVNPSELTHIPGETVSLSGAQEDEPPFLQTQGEVGNPEDEPVYTEEDFERDGEALPFSPNEPDSTEESKSTIPPPTASISAGMY